MILSENAYKKYKAETPRDDVESEEHWFTMEMCIKKNSDVDVIKLFVSQIECGGVIL